MSKTKNKLNWCMKSEKRMKKISPDFKLSKQHIEKAKHNLKAADLSIRENFEDWAVSQLYYSIYHSLLSILFSKGYKSQNHECTFNLIEYFIEKQEIPLEKEDLAFIRTTEQMRENDAKSLREEFQYGVKTSVNKDILDYLNSKSKKIIEKVEIYLDEITSL